MEARDPICGMQVDTEKAAATREYQGTTYYFCAEGCAQEFDQNPEKYVGSGEPDCHEAHHGDGHGEGHGEGHGHGGGNGHGHGCCH